MPETTIPVELFAGIDPSEFTLRSPAVAPGDLLPFRHSRAGSNIAPELQWQGVPGEAVELAIVMTDLNANNFVHWVITGIDPFSTTVFEGLVPPGAVQAINDFGELGWGGPAPPVGDDAHSYVFKIFALGELSGVNGGELGADLIPRLEANAIGVAELPTFYRQANAIDP